MTTQNLKDVLIRNRILREINLLCSSVPNDVDVKDNESVTPYRVYVGRVGLVPVDIGNDIEESSGIQISSVRIRDVLWEGRTRVSFTLLWTCSGNNKDSRVESVDVFNKSTWICRTRGVGQHRIHRMPVDTDATQITLRLVFTGSHDLVPNGSCVRTLVVDLK